jgi:NAD(P)H-binding
MPAPSRARCTTRMPWVWAVAPRQTADRVSLPLLHGTRIVVNAMTAAGIGRLIYVSDAALHEREHGEPVARLIQSIVGNPARRESRQRETVVQESMLDWTIVRPSRLTAGPHTGACAVTADLPAKPAPVSRTDAAAFITSQLGEHTYLRQIPHLV